ncbi:penicillin-binding protein [Campylobacterota bacterium]|nr:penicillin-binding protein [Campylobacterota bacterium]
MSVLALTIVVIVVAMIYLVRTLSIKTDPLIYYQPQLTTQIYDRNGELIANLFGEEHRIYVPFEEIPSRLIEALVAIEDTSFFEHYGVNFEAIGRALIRMIQAGKAVEGASTITQQLVKTTLLSPEKTIDRKMNEAIISMRVELTLSKEQILERYLNAIYFGHNYYGVRTAALGYFRKNLSELTLKEMALLAGLPRRPNFYDPTKHYQMSLTRANLVIGRMYALGWIGEGEYQAAMNESPTVYDDTLTKNRAPYAVDAIAALLRADYPDLRTGGYTVYTTLDLGMQQEAEAAISRGFAANAERLKNYYTAETARYSRLKQNTAHATDPRIIEELAKLEKNQGFLMISVEPSAENNFSIYGVDQSALSAKLTQLNAALVTIEPQTGDLLALVGGVDYSKSVFNRAFQSKRQLGSAFKPFIYLAAFDLGYSPASSIADISRTYKAAAGPDEEEKVWRPTNFEDNFVGIMTAREAVVNSRNLATINLVGTIGVVPLFDKLSSYLPRPLAYDMTYALGADSLSPLEFSEYWTVISNLGVRMKARVASEVINRYGNSKTYESQGTIVTKPEQAYLMVDVLRDAVNRGTGRRARLAGIEIAGKTGTTNDSRDAWFAGFTPDTQTIIWFGNDDDSPMGAMTTGGGFSAPVFGDYYKELSRVRPERKRRFDQPEGVREITLSGGKKEIFTDTSKPPRELFDGSGGSTEELLF